MKITRMSPLTGRSHTWDLDVTEEQIHRWEAGELIQKAMPQLDAGQREFIKSGITPREWDMFFPEDDEDEDVKSP